ncbi:phosphopentomutase [Ruminococcaceae bacterium OttesenSCG-928-D13]|nr:phosphopentomutase [Ruminococcaceae bacterium OttesenSCG-928-D13]
MAKRAFIIVLDSVGIGNAPDAADFGDAGSNTLAAIAKSPKFNTPNLAKLGLFNIDGVNCCPAVQSPEGAFARLVEQSKGKDTTIGHWEIAGLVSEKPMPTFPDGFPMELMDKFATATGRDWLCNKPYSGTDVIRDYGEEHMRTGALIVYTSADSVFQIAANEAVVPLEELYRYCELAREMLTGDWAVGRVIARPFVGDSAATFKRTANRHDFSLTPPRPTVLDSLSAAGLDVIGVGKIYDIFAGQGVTEKILTKSNAEGMEVTQQLAKRDFEGLAFVNLVEFDMVYGHRNDVDGYANAMSEFDVELGKFLPAMGEEDLLIITADHGCDPSTASTDHSRECVPMLAYGAGVQAGVNLGARQSFAGIASTLAEYFGLPQGYDAPGFWGEIRKK